MNEPVIVSMPTNRGYIVTPYDSGRCIHGVQLTASNFNDYRACQLCFDLILDQPDPSET